MSDRFTPGLARRLGTGDAVVIGLGSMVGAGVFAAFAPAADVAGAALLVGLAIAAVVAYCNATASAQLAAQYPTSGGTYVYGRERLGSRTYQRIMRWNSRVGLGGRWDRLRGLHAESVIQDVDIPFANAPAFLDFFQREIGIAPVWLCPLRGTARADRFPLYRLPPGELFVNFGFWDVVRTREPHPPGHFNRLVERKVEELGGIKSLYSDSYYTPGEFDAIYGGQAYRELKRRYDPQGRLRGLYEKCVLKK